MNITKKAWNAYITKLWKLNRKAAQKMESYIDMYGFDDVDELINAAYVTGTEYGGAAATLACEMYEAIAAAQGVILTAIPAEFVSRDYVAKTVLNVVEKAPTTLPDTVGALVKRAATDTMQENAKRDGAQYAWIASGDGCPYCMYLASFGWKKSKKTDSRMSHIHANCRCEMAVRFDGESDVVGYDPKIYRDILDSAGGDSPKEKINNLRVKRYAEEKQETQ